MSENLEKTAKLLIEKFNIEISYYENFMNKLKEEMEFIKTGNIKQILDLLEEKKKILRNIDNIEKQLKKEKEEYYKGKQNGFISKELERVLARLSFLIEELIHLQEKNAILLSEIIGETKLKLNQIKKHNALVAAYKNRNNEGLFFQIER